MIPYNFQENAANKAVSTLHANKRALLQSATGSGKTFIAGLVIQKLDPVQTLIIVNTQALVTQVYNTFKSMGISVSVLHNDIKRNIDGTLFETRLDNSVIITMVETLNNQPESVLRQIDPDFVVIDEAHKSTSSAYQEMRDRHYHSMILGLTATPGRVKNKEGEQLTDWYGEENLIVTVSVQHLIELGLLAQPYYKVMDKESHIAKTWLEETKGCSNRRTIVFGQNTRHIVKLKESFQAQGISAEIITTNNEEEGSIDLTPNQRAEIYRKFRSGEIEVLISINALCEGFDEPLSQFCFLCRRIGRRNVPFYHQIIGRVLRGAPGKDHGMVIDFDDNVEHFGPIEDFNWDRILDGTGQQFTHVENNGTINAGMWERYEIIHVTCDNCYHVYDIKKHSECIHCGQKHNVSRIVNLSTVRDWVFEELIKTEKGLNFLLGLGNNSGKTKTKNRTQKIITAETLKSQRRVFDEFLKKVEIARNSERGLQLNNFVGVNIFEDGSEFTHEFEFLKNIVEKEHKNVSMEEAVEV